MNWDMKNERKTMTLSIVVFATLIVYYHFFYRRCVYASQENDNRSGMAERKNLMDSSCKNSNCIRCQRYRYVQERAQSKLSWILWDLKARDPCSFSTLNRRIPDAINLVVNDRSYIGHCRDLDNDNPPSYFQDPTVLLVLNLPSREIVTDWHYNSCEYLKHHQTRNIVSEALQSLDDIKICGGIEDFEWSDDRSLSIDVSSDDSKWTVNDSSPQGDWRVFSILNQGVWNPVLLCEEFGSFNSKEPCRKLLELVRNIPSLLTNSLFGNVFISKIYPGTIIEPHCGPTNIRHRLQFLLKLPKIVSSCCSLESEQNTKSCDVEKVPTLSLSVGRDEKILWDIHNDSFVFDDSFVHSVTYRDEEVMKDSCTPPTVRNLKKTDLRNKDSLARLVLIVDLWHPELDDMEIRLLQDLYPPYSSSCKK